MLFDVSCVLQYSVGTVSFRNIHGLFIGTLPSWLMIFSLMSLHVFVCEDDYFLVYLH